MRGTIIRDAIRPGKESEMRFYINKSMGMRALLAMLALALAAVPASAAIEYYSNLGTNNWVRYNYVNLKLFPSHGEEDFPTGKFSGVSERYSQYNLNNFTTESHCYEVEAKAPENHGGDVPKTVHYYIFDNAQGKYADLGTLSGHPKARVWLKNGGLQMFLAGWEPMGSHLHFGHYVTRLNKTEAECTPNTMTWVKIKDGAQSTHYVF
jgi:hypothetical protein